MKPAELKALIGQELQIRGFKYGCIGASDTAVLLMEFGRNNHPVQYVVSHHPYFDDNGVLVWEHGSYYPFFHAEYCGNTMSSLLQLASMELNDTQFYTAMVDDEYGMRCIGVFTDRPFAVSELVKVMNRSDYVLGYCYEKKKERLTLEEYNVLKEELSLDNSYWIEEHKPNEASL